MFGSSKTSSKRSQSECNSNESRRPFLFAHVIFGGDHSRVNLDTRSIEILEFFKCKIDVIMGRDYSR